MAIKYHLHHLNIKKVRPYSAYPQLPADSTEFAIKAFRYFRNCGCLVYSPNLKCFVLLVTAAATDEELVPEIPDVDSYGDIPSGSFLAEGRAALYGAALAEQEHASTKAIELDRVFNNYGQFIECKANPFSTPQDCLWPLAQALEQLFKWLCIKPINFRNMGHDFKKVTDAYIKQRPSFVEPECWEFVTDIFCKVAEICGKRASSELLTNSRYTRGKLIITNEHVDFLASAFLNVISRARDFLSGDYQHHADVAEEVAGYYAERLAGDAPAMNVFNQLCSDIPLQFNAKAAFESDFNDSGRWQFLR